MRKLVVVIGLCLSLCMLLALPAAAETSLSFGLGFGEYDFDLVATPGESEFDLTGAYLGFDYSGEILGAGLYWFQGDLDDDVIDSDTFSIQSVYGSWRLLKANAFRLDAVLSYDWVKAGEAEMGGFIAGLKGTGNLSDRWSLEAGLGYAINPKLELNDVSIDDDENLWKTSLQLKYQMSYNWSFNIGYLNYHASGEIAGLDVKETVDIVTLGFTYRFGEAKPVEEPQPEPVVEAPKEEPKPVEEPKVEEPKPVEEPKVEEPVKQPEPEPVVEPKPITEEPKPNETPEEKEQRIERINEFLHPIFFNFDKYYIRKDQIPVLKEALKVLKANKDLFILIAGHADPPGSNAYNQKLSERRALSVRNWLVANGISASRITMMGYGEEYPFMAQSNDPQWESDRWADIVMTDQVPTKEMGIRK